MSREKEAKWRRPSPASPCAQDKGRSSNWRLPAVDKRWRSPQVTGGNRSAWSKAVLGRLTCGLQSTSIFLLFSNRLNFEIQNQGLPYSQNVPNFA
jgi:hypothetical protein